MKLALHFFHSTREKTGGLYYFNAISVIARNMNRGVEVVGHDFFDLLAAGPDVQRDFVRSLDDDDMVVSNAGPYAAFYHHLRQRHGGTFRILREVQTSSWGGYLLQEALCAPLQRPGDRVVLPSEFARQYFLQLFDGQLQAAQTLVGHPMHADLPSDLPPRVYSDARRIGYIGRISDDKNFGEVLDAFAALHRDDPAVQLCVAGPFDQSRRFPGWAQVLDYLRHLGVPAEQARYMGALPHSRIWEFFAQVDVFLFPAVASVETLGRVILEATHAGVPVVACRYAAAPELLPAENLVDTDFAEGNWHDPIGVFSFGKPDKASLRRALDISTQPARGLLDRPQFTTGWFEDLLSGARVEDVPVALDPAITEFLDRLEVADLPRYDAATAMQLSGALIPRWARYNNQSLFIRLGRALSALTSPGVGRQERMMALARLVRPSERHAIGNARELCRMAGFKPRLRIAPRQRDDEGVRHAI